MKKENEEKKQTKKTSKVEVKPKTTTKAKEKPLVEEIKEEKKDIEEVKEENEKLIDDNAKTLYIFLLVGLVIVLLFPTIHKFFDKVTMPKVENTIIEEEDKKELTDEILDSLHYPVMRSDVSNSNSYYDLDKFKVTDMSNNDILLTAFLDIEDINIVNNQFNAEYIGLRAKNILKKDIKYDLTSFYVPTYLSSTYAGTWTYSSGVYTKTSGANLNSNVMYITLDKLKNAEYGENDDIIVYKYLGFAKVENNTYTIYKDSKMTKEIENGTFTTEEDLNETFKNINDKKLNVYKYTFKDTLCSYNDYCLSQGEWVK